MAMLVAALACWVGACAAQLPTYEWTGTQDALDVMAQRADAVTTFSSPCAIFVKRRDGYTISLDGAVAARIPGYLRLRAWKLGQAVMDVTVTPDGVWTLRGDGRTGPGEGGGPGPTARHLAEVWSLFTGEFYTGPNSRVIDSGGSRFSVERPMGEDGGVVRCEIDRATLTARTFAVVDASGRARLTLTLDRYRLAGDVPWPNRLIAEIAEVEAAPASDDQPERVTIRFDGPELNAEIPAGAFSPPKRAVKWAPAPGGS
jgi:hypothetical protein